MSTTAKIYVLIHQCNEETPKNYKILFVYLFYLAVFVN